MAEEKKHEEINLDFKASSNRTENTSCCQFGCFRLIKKTPTYGCIASILFVCSVVFIITYLIYDRSNQESNSSQGLSLFADNDGKGNIGSIALVSNEGGFKECTEYQKKLSFPDIDYTLLGYNILRGYPLAFGHDPGFTLPIFKADYTSEIQTADCRYTVPKGLVVIPDVSCVTSFSSTTVQTSYELSKSLAVSANVQGGGWGVKFKASAGYKESSSTVSSGEFVYIISSAHCNYYFAKLTIYNPPELTSDFLDWVEKLDKTNDIDTYFNFFDYYGTHFSTETSFGATYTFENKMTSQSYQTQLQKGVNVAASASYSGLVSVSGGFTLDTDQRSAASEFRKEVTTKTITVGAAPPANGNAMTWASSVKESPVPVKYSLSSIDKLFTHTYMPHLNVNLTRLTENLQEYLQEYCGHLQTMGLIDSCLDESNGQVIGSTKLSKHATAVKTALLQTCLENCAEDNKCVAISFCKQCTKHDLNFGTCFMFNENQTAIQGTNDDSWESTLMRAKISNRLILNDTSVNGNSRGIDKTRAQSEEICQSRCKTDVHCIAYSYCTCPDKSENCKLFASDRINHLFQESGTTTFFVAPKSNI